MNEDKLINDLQKESSLKNRKNQSKQRFISIFLSFQCYSIIICQLEFEICYPLVY